MRECWAVEKMAPKTGEWVTLIVYRSEMAAAIARAGMSKSAEYRVVRYVPVEGLDALHQEIDWMCSGVGGTDSLTISASNPAALAEHVGPGRQGGGVMGEEARAEAAREWQAIIYGDHPETWAALAYYRERGWPVDDNTLAARARVVDMIHGFQSGYRAALEMPRPAPPQEDRA